MSRATEIADRLHKATPDSPWYQQSTEDDYLDSKQYEEDKQAAIDVFMEEHFPDDDFPLTVEWLFGVGFTRDRRDDGDFYVPPCDYRCELKWCRFRDRDMVHLVGENHRPVGIYMTTRGEVRLLFRGLGNKLKG